MWGRTDMTAAREADPIDRLMSEMTVHRLRQKAGSLWGIINVGVAIGASNLLWARSPLRHLRRLKNSDYDTDNEQNHHV